MKKRKFLSRALGVLLSGAMLAGSIPAAFAEDYDLPLLDADKAGTVDHTYSGYVSLWDESFDDFTDGIGSGWTTKDKDGDGYDWGVALAPTLSHCGDRLLVSGSSYWIKETNEDVPLDPENWLYAPVIELPEGNEYMLTFDAKGKGNTFGVYVAVGRYSTNYVQIGSDYTIATYDWTEYTIDLSEYAGKYIKLAFVHYNSTSDHDLYLDCVNISNKPKGYTKVNSWGFEDVEFDGESIIADVPSGFIAADKDGDGYTWEVLKADWNAHTGECYLRSRRKSADVVADNWLRLPQLRLDNDKDYLLTFYVTDSFAYQTVDVYLYGDDCYDGKVTPEDLEGDGITEYYSKVLTEDIDVVGSISGWHEVKVDLSDYAGQYVYAAIVQHGGQGEMCVDDIALWQRAAHTPEGDRTNVYFEGFENEDKKLPEGWETFNKDGDSYNWNACYGGSDKIHHGKGGVYSNSYNGGALTPDNWLVMPSYKVSTTMKTTLTFEAVGSHYEDYNEVFGVFISVDGGEFEQIGKDYTANYAWQEVEVDLTPYAGKSVRVAVVHHNCTDQESLILDCFNIWEEPFEAIQSIDITVDRPMLGETVPTTTADYAKLTAASHDITSVSKSCVWYKIKKNDYETLETPTSYLVAEGETFSSDYVYNLFSTFQLNEGYSFADTVKITVNGFDDYFKASEFHSNNSIAVMVTFYPLEAYITDVSAKVTEPVIGAVPDTSPVVKFTPDKELLHVAMWFKAPKEDYTTYAETVWEPISDPTEKFAEGYVYAVVIAAANQGMEQYEFTPDTTVSINGKTAFPMENAEEGYCASPALIGGAAVFDLSSTKPQNVKATPVVNGAKITWDNFSGATKYKVLLENVLGTVVSKDNVTTNSYTWTGLVGGAQYSFAVMAYVDGAWTEASDWSTIKTAVAAPANIKATAVEKGAKITWDTVKNATKYKVVLKNVLGTIVSKDNITGNSYTWTGLVNGAQYSFTVMAYNNGVWSAAGTWSTVKIVTDVPTNVKATAVVNGAKITWDNFSGATKYKVLLKNVLGTVVSKDNITTNSYTWTGLVGGAQYSFAVMAYVDGKWTEASDWSTIKTAVAAPANVKATAVVNGAKITWDTVNNTTKYKVVLKNALGTIVSKDNITTNSYTWTGLVGGAQYSFSVMAYNNGVWSAAGTWSTIKTAVAAPANIKATAVVNGAKITWDTVNKATKYKVVLKNALGTIVSKDNITGNSYTWTGLVGGAQYSFSVMAYNNGVWSAAGTWSTVKTAVAVPTITSVTSTKTGTATIKWNAVSNATKYKVVLKNVLGTIVSKDGITSTQYDWTGLVSGGTYEFTVMAYNNGVWSAAGPWKSVKIS